MRSSRDAVTDAEPTWAVLASVACREYLGAEQSGVDASVAAAKYPGVVSAASWGKSLSDFWRHDRTQDRAGELESVVQGANALLGNMGSDFRVTWASTGVSYTDLQKRIVALDYSPLKNAQCPFPGDLVDEVIGYAVHEAGHCLWSVAGKNAVITDAIHARWHLLPDSLKTDWEANRETLLVEISRIQNVLEDAYVDYQIGQRWPVLAEYIAIARRSLDQRIVLDLTAIAASSQPDRGAVVNLWLAVALYCHPLSPAVSPPVKRAMDILRTLTRQAMMEKRAVFRQRMAVDAAAVLWQEFPTKERPWPEVPVAQPSGETKQGQVSDRASRISMSGDTSADSRHHEAEDTGQARREDPSLNHEGARSKSHAQTQIPVTKRLGNLDEFDPRTDAQPWGRKVVAAPPRLLESAAPGGSSKVEDLSASVARLLTEDRQQVAVYEETAGYDPDLATRAIAQVAREIREIKLAFRQPSFTEGSWLYGLRRGKLDERKLWKPFANDTSFHKRKTQPERPSLALGLLLDVSASMMREVDLAYQTAAIFSEGLRNLSGVSFAAWCYTGHPGKVVLSRVCAPELPGLCLAQVVVGGQTPSGAAIAGVKTRLERLQGKKKLLIHVTDGRPDASQQVVKAVARCQEAGIQVYAVGLSQHRHFLVEQYGIGNFECIQGLPDLPQAMARILRRLGGAS